MTGRSNIFFMMIATVCLSCFALSSSFAQSHKNTCEGRQDSILHKFVYTKVDQMPEPKDGLKALSKALTKSVKYPNTEADFQGKIIVAFVIEANGKIDGKRVIRNPFGNDLTFCQQLLKTVSDVKWKPGRCKGKAVSVLYFIPMNIAVQE